MFNKILKKFNKELPEICHNYNIQNSHTLTAFADDTKLIIECNTLKTGIK